MNSGAPYVPVWPFVLNHTLNVSPGTWLKRVQRVPSGMLRSTGSSIRHFCTVPPITCSGARSAPTGYRSLSVWDNTSPVYRHVPCISSRHVISRMVNHVSLQCPFYVKNECPIINKRQNAYQCMLWPLANSLSGHLLPIPLESGVESSQGMRCLSTTWATCTQGARIIPIHCSF